MLLEDGPVPFIPIIPDCATSSEDGAILSVTLIMKSF